MWTLNLSKESFKFSGAHFTIFSESQAERLHGHNYYVEVKMRSSKSELSHGMVVDLNTPKKMIKEICEKLDEKVLLPKESPYLKIESHESNFNITFSQKTYSFPQEDCALLPIENITIEELAFYVSTCLRESLTSLGFESYEVQVTETRGQSASFERSL